MYPFVNVNSLQNGNWQKLEARVDQGKVGVESDLRVMGVRQQSRAAEGKTWWNKIVENIRTHQVEPTLVVASKEGEITYVCLAIDIISLEFGHAPQYQALLVWNIYEMLCRIWIQYTETKKKVTVNNAFICCNSIHQCRQLL